MFIIPIKEGSPVALPAIHAEAGKAFRVMLVGVPEDADAVNLTLAGSCVGHDAVSADPVPGGEWKAIIPDAHFLSAGSGTYKVAATCGESSIPLGSGTVFVS